MKEERSKENFIDPEIDQLIEQYHKKPNKEVRDRLNVILIEKREKREEEVKKKGLKARDLGRRP